jgi:succinate dehydrogenase / fumarate reductase membrane anchor subunit
MATKFQSASGLKRVRGLGSAKSGAHHWWLQRVTAAGNLVLLAWFAASLLFLPDLSHATVTGWIASPFVAVPLLLLTLTTVWHMLLGVQVMLEDYLHAEGSKLLALIALRFFAVAIASLSVFAILKLAFGAADA